MLSVQLNERCCRRWTKNIKHFALHWMPSVEYDLLNGTHIGLRISVCLFYDKNMFRSPYMNQTTITYNKYTTHIGQNVMWFNCNFSDSFVCLFISRIEKTKEEKKRRRKDNTETFHFIRIVNKVSDRCAHNEKLSRKLVIYKNAKVKRHNWY